MEVTEAKEVIERGEGIYGHKYHNAMEVLAREHRNDPCPAELTKTKTLKYDGFECKVYFNYVPSYGFGAIPLNVWWGFAEFERGRYWSCPLREEIKTLEEACVAIRPVFVKVVERYKRKIENG